MSVGAPDLHDVQRLLDQAGLNWIAGQSACAGVARFFAHRERWSATHNLSGPEALRRPWELDFLDAVAVSLALAPGLPLIDVGAGSGVPGLIVALLVPDQVVELVEPRVKRSAFLRSAVGDLGLTAVQVSRTRWPVQVGVPSQVISRAVVSPADWPALAAEGGPNVVSILRMLAAERPPWPLMHFELAAAVDYAPPTAGTRRIERWSRSI